MMKPAAPWSRQSMHGWMLVLGAACVPLGDGISLALIILLGVALVVRRAEVSWGILTETPLGRVMLAMGVWLSVGIIAVAGGREGWLKPGEIGRWSPLLALPLVALSAAVVPRVVLRRAVMAFLLALGVAAAVAICQYVFDWRPLNGRHQALIPDGTRAVAGGFYRHRLKMAHVLLVGLAICVSRQLFVYVPPRRRVAEVLLMALFFVTLALTFTRGALVAAVAATAACTLFISWRWRAALLAIGLVVAVAFMLTPFLRQRLQTIATPEASSVRATIWAQAVHVLTDHPFGVGLGNYTPLIARYYEDTDAGMSPVTYPHNVVLAVWAETGPAGLVAFVWAWLCFAGACVQHLRLGPSHNDDQRVAAGAGFFGSVAFWVLGMSHDVMFHNAVAVAFMGLLGFVLAILCVKSPLQFPGR